MGRQCDENAAESDDSDLSSDHALGGDRETHWHGFNDLPRN